MRSMLFMVGIFFLPTGYAHSHEPDVRGCERLELTQLHDYNRDGRIQRRELEKVRDELYEEVDSDDSGSLSESEYFEMLVWLVLASAEEDFSALDHNGDGEIEQGEYTAAIEQLVDVID